MQIQLEIVTPIWWKVHHSWVKLVTESGRTNIRVVKCNKCLKAFLQFCLFTQKNVMSYRLRAWSELRISGYGSRNSIRVFHSHRVTKQPCAVIHYVCKKNRSHCRFIHLLRAANNDDSLSSKCLIRERRLCNRDQTNVLFSVSLWYTNKWVRVLK